MKENKKYDTVGTVQKSNKNNRTKILINVREYRRGYQKCTIQRNRKVRAQHNMCGIQLYTKKIPK